MKKAFIFLVSFLVAQLTWAGNHVIVIKGESPSTTGTTEVAVDPTGNGDIITITPAIDVTTITVTVKDENGEVIAEDDVPATTDGVYEVTTPETTEGGTIEVSDDNGLVHVEVE